MPIFLDYMDAEYLKKNNADILEKGKKECARLASFLSKPEFETPIPISEMPTNEDGEVDVSSLCFTNDRLVSEFRKASKLFYALAGMPINYFLKSSLVEHYEETVNSLETDIKVFVDEDGIRVYTPMVWPGKNKKSTSVSSEIRSKNYRDSVVYHLKKDSEKFGFVFSKYSKKTISFLFAYAKNTPKIFVRDSDNHDTKALQDGICGVLPGEDSAAFCDVFKHSVVTDRIPAGAYVTVKPGLESIDGAAECVAFWEKALRGADKSRENI